MSNALLNQRLKLYLDAEKAIMIAGQSYKIGNRTFTRADLAEVRREISNLISAGAVDETLPSAPARRMSKKVVFKD